MNSHNKDFIYNASRDNLAQNIGGYLGKAIEQSLRELEPQVTNMIAHNVKDIHQIEHMLDAVLDIVFDPRGLLLFKKICRHLYFIDQQAAGFYVHAYREMWDSSGDEGLDPDMQKELGYGA